MKVSRTVTGGEPVSLTDIKNFLRVDYYEDDSMLQEMITGAREAVENRLNISVVLQEVEVLWPEYKPVHPVPYAPVVEWDTLTIDDDDVTPPTDDVLRESSGELYAKYTAGYSTTPADIIHAIRKLIKYNYDGEGDQEQIFKSIDHYNRNFWI